MTTEELHDNIVNKDKLTIEEVKQTIEELKRIALDEIIKNTNFNVRQQKWFQGEINGFLIALNLLEKVKEVK